jgi:hypothetical protein
MKLALETYHLFYFIQVIANNESGGKRSKVLNGENVRTEIKPLSTDNSQNWLAARGERKPPINMTNQGKFPSTVTLTGFGSNFELVHVG